MTDQTSATVAQAKTEEGAKEQKGKKKFLSKFVTFLIMGGWLLILFLGVAIVIVISLLTAPAK